MGWEFKGSERKGGSERWGGGRKKSIKESGKGVT